MKRTVVGSWALVVVCLAAATAAEAGTISGVVIDGFTGQPVVGATLEVEGTEVVFRSGLGGAFAGELADGTYSVLVTREGFEGQRITGVVVSQATAADFAVVLLPATDAGQGAPAAAAPSAAGATTETSVGVVDETTGELGSSAAFVGEVTVTADAASSTEAALLTERRNAAQISDSIGTEEMKKSTGSDAADVVKRVTGVSLQGDKYVYVRGLGERYSNTALNGSRIPSTEYEKKVVPLDLFPAGLLEKIRVSKSYTADKPGDFAAGFVEMETLDFPATQHASIGMALGHHSIATGEQFGRYGSGLGWSGSGGQSLPVGIPDEKLVRLSPITGIGFTPAELQQFGALFIGDWRGTAGAVGTPWGGGSYDAPLDSGYNLSYGNTFGRFGVVLSGTYGSEYRAIESEKNFYRYSELNPSGVELDNSFDFDNNIQTVKKGMVANFAYRMADNHHLKFRSLLNTLSFAETMFQEGFFSDLSAADPQLPGELQGPGGEHLPAVGRALLRDRVAGQPARVAGLDVDRRDRPGLPLQPVRRLRWRRQLRPDRQLVVGLHVLQRPRGHRRRRRRGLDQVPFDGLELRQRQGRRRLDNHRPRLLRPPLPLQEPRRPGRRPQPGAGGHLRRGEHQPQRLRDRGDHAADRQLHRDPGDSGGLRPARLELRQVAADRRRALRGRRTSRSSPAISSTRSPTPSSPP